MPKKTAVPKKAKSVKKEETPQAKIAEISRDIVKIEHDATKIKVVSQEDYKEASAFLTGVLKPRIDRVQAVMDFFVKPHQEARRKALEEMKKIEQLFAPQLNRYKEVERVVKNSVSAYLREQEAAARKEEERLAKLRDKQNERREEKGLDPVATALPTVARPEATVKTESGGKTTAKKVWRFEINNYGLLPKEVVIAVMLEANQTGLTEKVVRKMVNSGVHEINGVRIWEDFDISSSAAKF